MSLNELNTAGPAGSPAVLPSSLAAICSHPGLAIEEKRAILSDWASDRHAVESKPWARDVPGVGRLYLKDILAGLQSLDRDDSPSSGEAPPPARRRAMLRCRPQLVWNGGHYGRKRTAALRSSHSA